MMSVFSTALVAVDSPEGRINNNGSACADAVVCCTIQSPDIISAFMEQVVPPHSCKSPLPKHWHFERHLHYFKQTLFLLLPPLMLAAAASVSAPATLQHTETILLLLFLLLLFLAAAICWLVMVTREFCRTHACQSQQKRWFDIT